jgi:hypothetical protein
MPSTKYGGLFDPGDRAVQRGVFRSVAGLERAITTYIDATNADPKPFRRTKSADDILASFRCFYLRTLATCAHNVRHFRIRTLAACSHVAVTVGLGY